MRRRAPLLVLLALLLSSPLRAQTPVEPAKEPAAIEALPDSGRPAPAEVAYAHPLYRPVDQPPKLAARPAATDFEGRTLLVIAVRVEPDGQVSDADAVQPPVKGLASQLTSLFPRWRFEPAKKDGQSVRTWASYGIDLAVEIEKPIWASFSLQPLGKEEPLATVRPELSGEQWMLRYPKEPSPRDPGIVSIEDVDFLPTAKKTSWKFEGTRLRSRVTALVLVPAKGGVERIVPTGSGPVESLVVAWVRKMAASWKVAPAVRNGQPVESWMVLDGALEYDLSSAKEVAKRMFKKNLRGTPQ